MFHRLALLGAVGLGLSAVVLLGCGDGKPKSSEPAQKQAEPLVQEPAPEQPAPEKPAPPEAKPSQPDATVIEPDKPDADAAPEDEADAEATAKPGSAGRALGKVLKHMMEDNAQPARKEAPRFDEIETDKR